MYENIKKSRHSLEKVGSRGQNTRTIVKDFANLQKRLLVSERLRTSVESLSTQAPRDVQEIVQSVIKNHGNSAYLDFAELERVLLARDYEKLRTRLSQTLINKEHLIADLTKTGGKHFEKFLNTYMSTRLDVVSLADARATAASMTPSALFDEKLKAQILALFDFVEDSLRFVPHARREAMQLGDYIERHGYVAKSAQRRGDFMVDVLKNKIAEVLGKTEDLEGADFIDWEFAGLRTNPALHKEEEARVREALAQGKGYSSEATSEHLLESGLNGRAA